MANQLLDKTKGDATLLLVKTKDDKSSLAAQLKLQKGLAKEELEVTKNEQSHIFVKPVARIADLLDQDYKSGGTTRIEVIITQVDVVITVPVRPTTTIVYGEDGTTVNSTWLRSSI